MRHIIPISGKDSLATALLQTTINPCLPYEFIFNDTGSEYPEVYAWLGRIETSKGWKIERIGLNLQELIKKNKGFLPSKVARYCTKEAKIQPMIKWLGKSEATIYYGLRADEQRTGFVPVGNQKIRPAYPLQDFNIDLQAVYSIVKAQDLLPPSFFWKRLFDSVLPRIKMLAWEDRLHWYQKEVLFSGRSRANCFHCFFQRKYEWLWLKETHPELFEAAKAMEKQEYSHIRGYPLKNLDNEYEYKKVFMDRVKEVAGIITQLCNLSLFEEQESEIAFYSCGLLCGK